jgi:RNA polymerase primary sigma factor
MYKYEIWDGGCCLHEDEGFEDWIEVKEEAEFYATIMLEYNLEDVVIDNMNSGHFYSAFKTTDVINDKERLVLEYRNGFIDGKAWTLEEIAKLFGLTRERIRQIEARALRKLGKNPRFKEYVDRIHYNEDAYVYENTYKSLKRRYLEK